MARQLFESNAEYWPWLILLLSVEPTGVTVPASGELPRGTVDAGHATGSSFLVLLNSEVVRLLAGQQERQMP
jgi:hypothetical protein